MGIETNPSGESPKSLYRPEIDGLRALAVIAVIVNHFNKDVLPSGYLGVDIFFVISGFVITSSLASRPSKNLGDLLMGFYARRIKRLVPALVSFVAITSVLICLFNPRPNSSLETGIAALFGLSNLSLLKQSTNYFAASTELNVFAHTWSLGVEEQFYFLFPFLVWFTGFSRRTTQGSRNLFWVMVSLSVASLITFIYLYQTNQSAAYFLMPTRLWELSVGCLLFLGSKYSSSFFLALKNISPLLITAAVVGTLFMPLQFAVQATIAVVGLSAVLIACLRSGTSIYNLFTHPAVVYIGSISYSLYLWHWGVLSLSRWTIGIHWWSVPIQAALILILSIASYRYIETPLRRSSWAVRRWQSIGYGISASLCSALVLSLLSPRHTYLLIKGIHDIPYPHHFLPLKDSGLNFNPTCVVDDQERPLTNKTFQQCTLLPKADKGQTIWALGDSHMGHHQGLLYAVHDKVGLGIHLIETPRIPFPMTESRSLAARETIYESIKPQLQRGDIVLVSRLFLESNKENKPEIDLPEWSNKLITLADFLAARGVNLVIIGPPPIFQIEAIDLCRSALLSRFHSDCSRNRAQLSRKIGSIYNSLTSTAKMRKNIHVFNQFDLLCPISDSSCSVIKNGVLFFRDKDHLNSAGSAYLSTSFINFLSRNSLLR
jgi:peptidoglycan/LPS O-acetylase OafA/YrhL